jgi:hypothetical protein
MLYGGGDPQLLDRSDDPLLLRAGFDLTYDCAQPTPMVVHLNVHYSRAADIVRADFLITEPPVPLSGYRDSFGNWCTRLVAPAGGIRLTSDALVRVTGLPDEQAPDAAQHYVEDLPSETLVYLLGSRYCETDKLSDIAWALFGNFPTGWSRVQAVCAFVHQHIRFDYQLACSTRSGRGVPGLRPSGADPVPLPQHSRALLHGLPGRYRRAAGRQPNGFFRLVRSVFGRPLVYV